MCTSYNRFSELRTSQTTTTTNGHRSFLTPSIVNERPATATSILKNIRTHITHTPTSLSGVSMSIITHLATTSTLYALNEVYYLPHPSAMVLPSWSLYRPFGAASGDSSTVSPKALLFGRTLHPPCIMLHNHLGRSSVAVAHPHYSNIRKLSSIRYRHPMPRRRKILSNNTALTCLTTEFLILVLSTLWSFRPCNHQFRDLDLIDTLITPVTPTIAFLTTTTSGIRVFDMCRCLALSAINRTSFKPFPINEL